MITKRQRIIEAAAAGEWRRALGLASTINRRRLGEHHAAIMRGHEGFTHPAWARQLKRDPAADIEAGVAALKSAFNLESNP